MKLITLYIPEPYLKALDQLNKPALLPKQSRSHSSGNKRPSQRGGVGEDKQWPSRSTEPYNSRGTNQLIMASKSQGNAASWC